VNVDWSILVYATKLQCATRNFTLAILSRNYRRCDMGLNQ